jgi:hypothetical protein
VSAIPTALSDVAVASSTPVSRMSYRIEPNTELEQGAVGDNLREALKKVTFLLSKASTDA